MKKNIFCFILFVFIFGATVYATIYNPGFKHLYDNDLPFTDLQHALNDEYGRPLYDSKKNRLYGYHKYINEILKSNMITIDKNGAKLIEGYANKDSGDKPDGTYSFKPDATISYGEFIKMGISLANNRSFDYSIFPIPDDLKSHWAAPYVVVAEMQGVIESGDIGSSNVDEPMNRLDMIKILSKVQINMKGVTQYRDGILPNYTDIDKLTEEEKALLLHAAKYDLIEGMFEVEGNELKIRPYDNITRAEAARAILRVY